MKSALFYSGRDIRIGDLQKPCPETGEVLIRVRAAGICGGDLRAYRADIRRDNPPWTAGHENSGEVAALGPEITALKVGDRVAIDPTLPNRDSPEFLIGRNETAIVRTVSGGFGEFIVVPEENLHIIPDNVSFEAGAMAEVYAVALHALTLTPVQPGDMVAVIGSGPVGVSIAEMAVLAGAEQIIVLGKPDAPLELAAKTLQAPG